MRPWEATAWLWICGFVVGSSALVIHPHHTPGRQAQSHERDQTAPGISSASLVSRDETVILPFLRGVNIGGWLILEQWMNGDVFAGFDANDQHSFDSQPGAAAALDKHWSSYFTQDDVSSLTPTGINALRIPIGFWAYDNANTGYIQGADAYLEKAVGWARDAGLKVWIDLHGAPGSQNGFDNSGQAGAVDWQQGSNIDRTISVLTTMASKYGAQQYADTVVGLELVNEPISWDANNINTTQRFAVDAYHAVRAAAANKNLMIVMHDAFQDPSDWAPVAASLNAGAGFAIDTHLYQNQVPSDLTLTQPQHVAKVCKDWSSTLSAATAVMPTYVGEWSASTQICVDPSSDTTTPGTTCSTPGCQCQTDGDVDAWSDALVQQTRRFVEAQLDTFEQHANGYFLWAWNGPGAWGFTAGIEKGFIPNPITDRRYPGQCT